MISSPMTPPGLVVARVLGERRDVDTVLSEEE
jgi:hypothetical protein